MRVWSGLLTFLRTWGVIGILIGGGLAIAYRFVAPPPPNLVRLATSAVPESDEARVIDAYASGLEREGFRVQRRETRGSEENLALLRTHEVDIALVQGGLANPSRDADLRSLGSVFFEPAWLFLRRGGIPADRALHLDGQRVAAGPEGSGTRVLAFAMLAANGVPSDRVEALPLTGLPAADALLSGEADAALFVSATPGPGISRLMRLPEQAALVNFASRADAYATALPYLTPVRLPRSGFSLPEDLPTTDITLMAPAASVITYEGMHPQIVSLMLRIMQETHRRRQLFAPEGRFPSALNQDLPMSPDVRRFYERGGPGLLQSYLPFWVAVTIDRLWVLLIPLLTLALPLIRFAPPLYTWQMENRVYRFYDELRRIERDIPDGRDRRMRDSLRERLDLLERKVTAINIPTSYGRHLFALRRDIAYVRARVAEA